MKSTACSFSLNSDEETSRHAGSGVSSGSRSDRQMSALVPEWRSSQQYSYQGLGLKRAAEELTVPGRFHVKENFQTCPLGKTTSVDPTHFIYRPQESSSPDPSYESQAALVRSQRSRQPAGHSSQEQAL